MRFRALASAITKVEEGLRAEEARRAREEAAKAREEAAKARRREEDEKNQALMDGTVNSMKARLAAATKEAKEASLHEAEAKWDACGQIQEELDAVPKAMEEFLSWVGKCPGCMAKSPWSPIPVASRYGL